MDVISADYITSKSIHYSEGCSIVVLVYCMLHIVGILMIVVVELNLKCNFPFEL